MVDKNQVHVPAEALVTFRAQENRSSKVHRVLVGPGRMPRYPVCRGQCPSQRSDFDLRMYVVNVFVQTDELSIF